MQFSNLTQHIMGIYEDIKIKKQTKLQSASFLIAAYIKFYAEGAVPSGCDQNEATGVSAALADIIKREEAVETGKILTGRLVSLQEDSAFRKSTADAETIAKKEGKTEITADILLVCVLENAPNGVKEILMSKPAPQKPAGEGDSVPLGNKGASTETAGKGGFGELGEITKGVGGLFNQGSDDSQAVSEPAPQGTPKEQIVELTEKVKAMQKRLGEIIFGQDNAISVFASGYFQSQLRNFTDKECKKPGATFLFAGPPGVGKTFLAENVAELLDLPYMRFDMSEYSEHDAVMELCGTNKSYKGDKEGNLTGFVSKNPRCVLLFDEIEKAHISAIHLFLQVLDAGRLRDINSGQEVDFSKTTIIFTTNAGRTVYEGSETPNLSYIPRKTILKALEKDVDPKTGTSAFPAAICSRFATGNVVMFNHMEAHVLHNIVKKEIVRNVTAFEAETGIKCNISEDVYSCILFAEGGHADARTVKSRATAFFSTELYELFRLISTAKHNGDITQIEQINITVDLSECEEKTVELFRNKKTPRVLVFASQAINDTVRAQLQAVSEVDFAPSYSEAVKLIEDRDYDVVLCDLAVGKKDNEQTLNVEDNDSEGKDLFTYVCSKTNTPLYIVYENENTYAEEEFFSLLKEGARGGINVSDAGAFATTMQDIFRQSHQQASMDSLARANKIVTYQTSQVTSADNKVADIEIYDVVLDTAVDAEDSSSILSAASKPDVKFADILGAKDAKEELHFFVEYLKNPKEFAEKGLAIPKGVLFYGPPGTGKTMLAKAVAGESDVTFISAAGNQFFTKYYGEGEASVRQLFATARKYAPAIIFIDEADAFAKERTGGDNDPQAQRLLTTFLSEMDGFKTNPKKPVFVLAATNYDIEPGSAKCIDSAFVRRFDRSIYVDLPDKEARIEFIRRKVGDRKVFDLSDNAIENIAVRSTGTSLAILELVFNMALRIAMRRFKSVVDDAIIEEAFETYNYGDEKKWDENELRKTAYHEAGHAFLCWYGGETPSYLTIVARGNHGGYMQHGDTEQIGSYTRRMLLNRIRTSLGGRAAELVFFGDEDGLTTGASSDLRSATHIAQSIICRYGMDDSMGLAVIPDNISANSPLAQQVRDAVNAMLKAELESAKKILVQNRVAIDKIVEELMVKTHLKGEEIDAIFSAYAEKENA